MADARSHFADLLLPAAVGLCILMVGIPTTPPADTIDSLQARLKLTPSDAGIREKLATLFLKAGHLDDAITAFRAALAGNPASTSIRCGLARALADRGGAANTLEAQRLMEESLKQYPTDAATNETLADLALKNPLLQSAGPAVTARIQKFYETAIASEPQRPRAALQLSTMYLDQSRVNDAARVLIPALAAHPRDAALHLQKAKILALAGHYKEAAESYNTGTALDPDNAEAYFQWGLALMADGRPENAERIFRYAVDLDPKNALYHMHFARALWKEGLTTDALNEFPKAIDKDKKCIPIYLELSSVFQELGNEKAAINFLHRGIEADPEDLPIKVALAKLLTRAKDPLVRDPWEAAVLLQTCVERTNQSDLSVLVSAAEAWSHLELDDKSLPLIETAISLARSRTLAPDQIEKLLSLRQKYHLALSPMPQLSNLTPYLAIMDISPGYFAMDLRAPEIKSMQPTMDKLLSKPLNLDKVPAEGSALDPDLFTKNLKPFFAPGYRP